MIEYDQIYLLRSKIFEVDCDDAFSHNRTNKFLKIVNKYVKRKYKNYIIFR